MPDTKTTRIIQAPTVTAGAYSANDAVGGLLTFKTRWFTPNSTGVILSVQIKDNAKQNAALELVLFSKTFTATANNDAFDPSDADMVNCLGVIPISGTDYVDFVDNSIATVKNIGLAVRSDDTTHGDRAIYGQLVTRGTPTYVATSDISVILEILHD